MAMIQAATLNNKYWIKVANHKFSHDAYSEALEMYKNINFNEEYVKGIYLNIAFCYQHLNEPQKALECYYKHLNDNVDDEYCIHNIAVLEYYHQNYSKALRMYKKMSLEHIVQHLLYFNVGICYLQQKEYQDAMCCFYKHLSLNTNRNRENCFISMAWIYTNEFNDNSKALDIYINKLNDGVIFKKNLEFDVAFNYQQMGRYKKALKYYKKYLKKNKNDINTLQNIAWIKINKMGNFESAKPFLIRIFQNDKNHFYANYVYGVYLRDVAKDYGLSLKCLKIAHNVRPNDVQLMNDIAKT